MRSMFLLTIVAAICLTFTGFAQAQIPSGLTKYKLKTIDDVQKIKDQAIDLGVTDAEIAAVVKAAGGVLPTVLGALTLDNKHPNYVLTFAGNIASFESGKEFVARYMHKSGKGTYTVDGNKIQGKETLDNGKTVDVEIVFEGKDVTVTRKSANVILHAILTQDNNHATLVKVWI